MGREEYAKTGLRPI